MKKLPNIEIVATIDMKRQIWQSNTSGNVGNANWNRDNQQANLNRNNPDNQNDNNGSRVAVKDDVFYCSDFSQPPNIRPISASFA